MMWLVCRCSIGGRWLRSFICIFHTNSSAKRAVLPSLLEAKNLSVLVRRSHSALAHYALSRLNECPPHLLVYPWAGEFPPHYCFQMFLAYLGVVVLFLQSDRCRTRLWCLGCYLYPLHAAYVAFAVARRRKPNKRLSMALEKYVL